MRNIIILLLGLALATPAFSQHGGGGGMHGGGGGFSGGGARGFSGGGATRGFSGGGVTRSYSYGGSRGSYGYGTRSYAYGGRSYAYGSRGYGYGYGGRGYYGHGYYLRRSLLRRLLRWILAILGLWFCLRAMVGIRLLPGLLLRSLQLVWLPRLSVSVLLLNSAPSSDCGSFVTAGRQPTHQRALLVLPFRSSITCRHTAC